jgi:hypothetical protein
MEFVVWHNDTGCWVAFVHVLLRPKCVCRVQNVPTGVSRPFGISRSMKIPSKTFYNLFRAFDVTLLAHLRLYYQFVPHNKYKLVFLLYCSNSCCTSLHFKTLNSHTKTLKIRPYIFRSVLKPSSGVHGRTSLCYWIGMLIYNCYKECRYVTGWLYVSSFCNIKSSH